LVKKLRRRERSAKRGARRVGVGAPDWTLTGLAGLTAVDELIGRLGIVEVLGRGIGPIKQRDRGLSGGQLLVGMASAQLVGQDCLDGMDRVRADGGSALLTQAPVAPSRTAARLDGRFGPAQLTGIETALSEASPAGCGRSGRLWCCVTRRSTWTPATSRSTARPSRASGGTTPASGPDGSTWPAGRRPNCRWPRT